MPLLKKIALLMKTRTVVATSTTEAEYVAAASGCGQVLWFQNQLLDYGHHFIRDCFEKKLISVDHIHIDDNVADLLTKPFDAGRFQYLVVEQAMKGPVKGNHIIYTIFLKDLLEFLTFEALWANSPSFLGRTVPLFPTMLVTMGESSGTPTEPHHTPFLEAQQTSPTATSSQSLPPVTTVTIPTSSALLTATDEPASPIGDDSQGEACPTVSGLETEHDRANITNTSTFPSDSTPRVTSLAADEGKVATVSVHPTTISVPTSSDVVLTARPIFTTVIVATPYTRRKGKEKMVESETPKKKKLQEQIDVQMARQLEEEMAKDAQRMNEQIARDAEIARIHTEEELQMMIDGLDRSNEMIAKNLHKYDQAAAELTIGEKIELINELVKYQDHLASILKYKAQQRKPLSKKQQREFYMAIPRSHAGWKTKHFKGMSLEEIKEKFDPVWKQIQDFVPMGSKEEGERFKRKGLRLEQESTKKVKTSEEVLEEDLKEMMHLVPVEEVYVEALHVKHPIIDWEHFDREYLNHLWALVKENLNIRQAANDKEKELWVVMKRLYEPNVKDQLWTHTQALIHDPVEWRLYDSCSVHHVLSKDQEIFMLVENDYPLRKGLAIVMISNKFHVENYSQMANDLILKIHQIANSLRQRGD
nr:hypothetical protein [Tanacetum cinerariifolium]